MLLNILPENKKRQIENETIYNSLRRITIIVVISFLILDGIIIGSRALLNYWENKITETATDTIIDPSVEQEVKEALVSLSTSITALQSLYATYNPPLTITTPFLKILPPETTLEDVSINFEENTLGAKGVVSNRDALAELQAVLNEFTYLEDINISVDDLSAKEDIEFTLNGNITYEITETK